MKKCPKCGGEMKEGWIKIGWQRYPLHFAETQSSWKRGSVEFTRALACKNCGYIELYIEKKK